MKVELKQCRYSQMAILPTDKYVGGSLIEYGEYYEGEVDLFKQLIRPEDTVFEIGAHFGSLAVPLAKLSSRFVCFEPQPVLFNLLQANLKLAGCQASSLAFNM